ncbi:MAG: hypothetical protein RIA69_01210 [Cyclobacteriaceae bacterium]
MTKSNRKKNILRVIAVLILIALISTPLIMRWLWGKVDHKPLSVFILDKTVLNTSYQEHLSLNWVLNHNKYVKSSGAFYTPEDDYYGFFPDGEGDYTIKDIEEFTDEELMAFADNYDMAYYTDLYGIYAVEWNNEYPEINPDVDPGRIGERSSLIYGGLTANELGLLKAFKKQKKLIVNEFNIIAAPTSNKLRRAYEKEFNLKWSGWTGRYFDNLDTTINKELPRWLINNYLTQNKNQWPFKNAGIAFVHTSDKVVILEKSTHLEIEVPVIHTEEEFVDYYGVVEEMKYPFWFDIIETTDQNQILSSYKISSNEKGDSVLRKWNIPKEFPAVISSKEDYPFFYFAGDFADNPVSMKHAKFKYINQFGFLFYESTVSERESFFWKFYQPLMKRIIDDYYQSNLDENTQ